MRRDLTLPDGRSLAIRDVEALDVAGLSALYAGLDEASLYRRFFSFHRPGQEFFEHMAGVGERGGAGLVAVLGADVAGGRIVAEAGFEILPDGNGELEITVDRAWRGWLGPYLLDALVDLAAAQGVRNLEADVLLTNGPMLAMLRCRGYATVPNGDWTIVRAVIGAGSPMPTWPVAHERLRMVVEGAGGHWHAADTASAAGLDVRGCPGPVGRLPRCPALRGLPCPLAGDADVIVIARPSDTEGWSTVRTAHPQLHPGVPVCVELPKGEGGAAGGETVVSATSHADIVELVRRLALQRAADAGDRFRRRPRSLES
jgi:hypothetical protein